MVTQGQPGSEKVTQGQPGSEDVTQCQPGSVKKGSGCHTRSARV